MIHRSIFTRHGGDGQQDEGVHDVEFFYKTVGGGAGGIILCSACGGQGFKHAPNHGMRVAELVTQSLYLSNHSASGKSVEVSKL